MRFQLIKCNPKLYTGLTLKLGNSVSKYVYKVDPKVFVVRDQLLILYDKATHSLKIVNKTAGVNSPILVPLNKYGSLMIQFVGVAPKYNRNFTWDYVLGKFYSINVEAKDTNFKRFNNATNKSLAPGVNSTLVNIKKPYWQKQGDKVRGQFSRNWRYNELTGVYADARLGVSSRSKFILANFLSWKFDFSVNTLRKLNQNKQLASTLLSSLIHIVTFVGAYQNFTSAKQSIGNGQVYVNGCLVRDFMYKVKPGDFISLLPSSSAKRFSSNKFIEAYPGDVFYIVQLPSIADIQLENVNMFIKRSSGACALLNPWQSTIGRSQSLIKRAF